MLHYQEMIITTSLLDFLEQSLEKVDINQLMNPARNRPSSEQVQPDPTVTHDLDTSSMSALVNSSQSSNFPVDIIVYCSVLPSTIRFRSVFLMIS